MALLGPCPSGPGVPLCTRDESPSCLPRPLPPSEACIWAPGTELQGALLRLTDHIWSQSPGPGPGHFSAPGIPAGGGGASWKHRAWIPPQRVATLTSGPPPIPRKQRSFEAGLPGPSTLPQMAACCCPSCTRLCLSSPQGLGARGCCWSCFLLSVLPSETLSESGGKARSGLEQRRGRPRPQGTPRPGLASGRAGPAAPLSQLGNRSP